MQEVDFLDAGNRLRYLNETELTADCSSDELLRKRNELTHLLHMQPLVNDVHCNQALYAATLLSQIGAMLTAKGLPPDSDEPKRDPVEWIAVRILTSDNGERRLAKVLRIYDHLGRSSAARRQLLERVVSASMLPRDAADGFAADARRLLDSIAALDSLRDMRAAVERLVHMKITGRIGLRLILDICLMPLAEGAHYILSCLIYRRFVQLLGDPHGCVFRRSIPAMVRLIDTDDGCQCFYKCLKLRDLYECMSQQLFTFLCGVRIFIGDGDYEEFVCPADDSSVRLEQIRRIVCCMLHADSPVQRKFEYSFSNVVMADTLRAYILEIIHY